MTGCKVFRLSGANMDIDLATPYDQIGWEQEPCPWNLAEGADTHRCAVKNVSICNFFCGIAYLDVVLCSYPHPNPNREELVINSDYLIEGPDPGKGSLCQPIIEDLPDWFGIPLVNQKYTREIDQLPTFVAFFHGTPVGFLTLKEHTQSAAEIYVMGVRRAEHRKGIGRLLIQACQRYLVNRQVEFLQVKTLSNSQPDENFARTRDFYQAMGFQPLEELPKFWDEANPCLVMVKYLSA